MARLGKHNNNNFRPNHRWYLYHRFRAKQARTLSALEVIIYHDLMHLSPGKLRLSTMSLLSG